MSNVGRVCGMRVPMMVGGGCHLLVDKFGKRNPVGRSVVVLHNQLAIVAECAVDAAACSACWARGALSATHGRPARAAKHVQAIVQLVHEKRAGLRTHRGRAGTCAWRENSAVGRRRAIGSRKHGCYTGRPVLGCPCCACKHVHGVGGGVEELAANLWRAMGVRVRARRPAFVARCNTPVMHSAAA